MCPAVAGFSLPDSGHGEVEHDKLSEWAPQAPPPERLPPSDVPHLPNVPPMRNKADTGKGTTSRPFQAPLNTLQASISYSLSRLLSLPRFAAYVATPLGYAQFSAYLASLAPESEALADLELWKDTLVLSRLTKQAGYGAKGIYQAYLTDQATPQVQLPVEVQRELFGALRKVRMGAPGLDSASKHLMTKLFTAEFERFVKARLLAHTKTQLSKYSLKVEDRGGIGSAFLLTNPRLRDDPIVLVSPGFCELTGYSAQQIIGRNCRCALFLAPRRARAPRASAFSTRADLRRPSPLPCAASSRARRPRPRLSATFARASRAARKSCRSCSTSAPSPLSLSRALAHSLTRRRLAPCSRADGAPFLNLLHVLPLRDLDGNLAYFLGGQTDMTRALTTGTDLSLILPEDVGLHADMSAFTPAVQLEAREAANKPAPAPGTWAGIDIPEGPAAAGPAPGAGQGHEKHGHRHGHGGDEAREPMTGVHSLVTLFGCGARPSHKGGEKGEGHGHGKAKAKDQGKGEGAQVGEGAGRAEEPTEGGRERQQGKVPLVAPTQKDHATTMPLEVRARACAL